jgi:hypothetical protein
LIERRKSDALAHCQLALSGVVEGEMVRRASAKTAPASGSGANSIINFQAAQRMWPFQLL